MYNAWGTSRIYPPAVVHWLPVVAEPSALRCVEATMATNHQATASRELATTDQPWVRLVDFCRDHGIGENRARRIIATLPSHLAEKRAREQGGKSEWWVASEALDALQANQPQATEDADAGADRMADKQLQTTDVDGWLMVVEEMRVERDRLHEQIREEQAARREAGERSATADARAAAAEVRLAEAADVAQVLRAQVRALEERVEGRQRQAEEAERARTAYAELLAEERAAWWQWCAYLKGLGMLRRLRGIPDPPYELQKGQKRLAAPEG